MVKAKNPGAGRGQGGGRPPGKSAKPPRQVEEVRLRLAPHIAELLRAMAEDQGIPAWRVVEDALLAGLPPGAEGGAGSPHAQGVTETMTPSTMVLSPWLPPEALELAQECAAFLEAAPDRPAAVAALSRAWRQALALARLNR